MEYWMDYIEKVGGDYLNAKRGDEKVMKIRDNRTISPGYNLTIYSVISIGTRKCIRCGKKIMPGELCMETKDPCLSDRRYERFPKSRSVCLHCIDDYIKERIRFWKLVKRRMKNARKKWLISFMSNMLFL